MSFLDFNLNTDFIRAIEAAGYLTPTELQSQLIPIVEARKNALVWSQSASGKTGAFLIPAMNYILENPAPEKRGARILILTSRRDRVSQINYTIKRLSQDLTIRFGFIVSGRPYQTQMRLMRRPLDIMIATPGRLNDLMDNGKADFSQLEMLIIDDLSSIYKKNLQGLIENIMKQSEEHCSAITFAAEDEEIGTYAQNLFPEAVHISVTENDEEEEIIEPTASPAPYLPSNNQETKKQQANKKQPQKKSIDMKNFMPQKVHIADDYTHKIAMMDHLMDEFAGEPTIIYTTSNKAAKTLQDNLSNHGHAAELISDVKENQFNECDILIYSDQTKINIDRDLMATLDKNIISFDLPNSTDAYVERLKNHQHNRENPTLLMLDGHNFNELKSLEKAMGEKIEQSTIPGLEPLKPFVNLSRGKAKKRTHTNTKNNNTNQKKKHSNGPNKSAQANKNTKNPKKKNRKNSKAKNQTSNTSSPSGDQTQRRQHKGAFGRLNGGTHRKNNKKIGVSRVGTDTPQGGRGWQSDFAEPKERSTDSGKKVKISYNKKRTLSIKKPEEL